MGRLGPPPCEGRRGEGEPRGSPRSSPGRRCLCPGAARRARGRGWQRPRSFVSGKGSRRRAQIKQNRKKKTTKPALRVVEGVWGAPWLCPRSFRAGLGGAGVVLGAEQLRGCRLKACCSGVLAPKTSPWKSFYFFFCWLCGVGAPLPHASFTGA